MRARIFFEDEAPRIGAGWRIVTVRIGRKWVRVKGPHGSARFTKDQYARLKAQEQNDETHTGRIKRHAE